MTQPKHTNRRHIDSQSKKTAPMIAVIGADGSGKSTVLKLLVKEFEHDSLRDVYLFDERSSSKRTPGKPIRNYDKPPRSVFISLLKISIRAFLWTINYYFHLLPLKRSRVMILCDQFYFLSIVLDPLKYRFGGSQTMSKIFLNMVPKPDYYICLDAPSEVIYARKQESTREELERLIARQREFTIKAPNGIVVDAARPIEEVTADISRQISKLIYASASVQA